MIQIIAEAGDNIVSASTLCGGTYNLFARTLPQFGIEARFADYREPNAFEKLIDGKTKALFDESIGNPLGNIADFEDIAATSGSVGQGRAALVFEPRVRTIRTIGWVRVVPVATASNA